ncbi:Uncharacterised protein [Mycobacteroides abscessus subsp. massiliense]|nr:Uncharacterised protein [Mycobacteroides abscessus subsp. massiliense]
MIRLLALHQVAPLASCRAAEQLGIRVDRRSVGRVSRERAAGGHGQCCRAHARLDIPGVRVGSHTSMLRTQGRLTAVSLL